MYLTYNSKEINALLDTLPAIQAQALDYLLSAFAARGFERFRIDYRDAARMMGRDYSETCRGFRDLFAARPDLVSGHCHDIALSPSFADSLRRTPTIHLPNAAIQAKGGRAFPRLPQCLRYILVPAMVPHVRKRNKTRHSVETLFSRFASPSMKRADFLARIGERIPWDFFDESRRSVRFRVSKSDYSDEPELWAEVDPVERFAGGRIPAPVPASVPAPVPATPAKAETERQRADMEADAASVDVRGLAAKLWVNYAGKKHEKVKDRMRENDCANPIDLFCVMMEERHISRDIAAKAFQSVGLDMRKNPETYGITCLGSGTEGAVYAIREGDGETKEKRGWACYVAGKRITPDKGLFHDTASAAAYCRGKGLLPRENA